MINGFDVARVGRPVDLVVRQILTPYLSILIICPKFSEPQLYQAFSRFLKAIMIALHL